MHFRGITLFWENSPPPNGLHATLLHRQCFYDWQALKSHRSSTPQSAFIPSSQRVAVIGRASELSQKRVSGVDAPRVPPERQLTIMLVCVCLAFVCLRLPYTTSYALHEYTKEPNKTRSAAEELPYTVATRISDVIATTNYMVNFFLYGLCGSYFRQQIRAAFGCRRGGRGEWNGGRQGPFGSRSASSCCSNRTSMTLATRVSVGSEALQLSTYRSHAKGLPPERTSVQTRAASYD